MKKISSFLFSCLILIPVLNASIINRKETNTPSQLASLMAKDLRCEYRINPVGMDVLNPRLSWILASDQNGQKQSAYRILVASSPELLANDKGDLWDSDKVNSDQTMHIYYKGQTLLSRMEVWWKVRVWDKDGNPSPWSHQGYWSMGLLKENDWEARWIADPAMVNNMDSNNIPNSAKYPSALPATYLRKSFTISSPIPIRKATAYVSALGLYEFRLNGQRIGDQILAPEWTHYGRRVSYQSYDVTHLIHQGQNAVAAQIGEGWYAGRLMWKRFIWGTFPRFLLQLEIEMDDGSLQTFSSDESWRTTSEGPILASGIYDGEVYDARLEHNGWDLPGFDDKNWAQVTAFNLDSRRLVWLRNEPIRVEKEMTPVKISEPEREVYVIDFGQNMVGWSKIKGMGIAGDTVTIRYAEAINEDGKIYTENLRGALQTDYYIPRKDGLFVYEPCFTYHGFRFVEISGLSDPPTKESITGRVFHSSSPFVGKFNCSDTSLNRLMENIQWTLRSNLMSSPNDCPQRDERLGWLGDIQVFAQTGIFNMDLAAFFTKFLQDIRDDQANDGRFPDYVPFGGDESEKEPSGVPAWGDAGVFLPWTAYLNYADTGLLADQFNAARRWVDYIHRNNPELIWNKGRHNDYNDWLNGNTIISEGWPNEGGEVPKEVFATAFFARSTHIVARMAEVIGRSKEASYYSQLADQIKVAFNKAFVQPDGRISGNTQAGYALALNFDLLPDEIRPKAAKYLVENIQDPYNGHLSTGIQTTHRAMKELSSNGYNNLAWQLLMDRTFPSWLYMIDNGATTIWERWDGFVKGRGFQNPGMNSLNHWALGAIGEWMWLNIIGLNPDEKHPGWKHFTIAPRPGGGVTWAKGEYLSIRGKIISSWEIKKGKFYLDVTVPPNTTAIIRIPTTNSTRITENGDIVTPETLEDEFALLTVESGTYHFISPYKMK